MNCFSISVRGLLSKFTPALLGLLCDKLSASTFSLLRHRADLCRSFGYLSNRQEKLASAYTRLMLSYILCLFWKMKLQKKNVAHIEGEGKSYQAMSPPSNSQLSSLVRL